MALYRIQDVIGMVPEVEYCIIVLKTLKMV